MLTQTARYAYDPIARRDKLLAKIARDRAEYSDELVFLD